MLLNSQLSDKRLVQKCENIDLIKERKKKIDKKSNFYPNCLPDPTPNTTYFVPNSHFINEIPI